METIKIRRQGYSHRIAFTDFVRRYAFLAFAYSEIVVPSRETARILLLRLNMDGWALGKTKVFLKYYHLEFLSRLQQQHLRKIIKVQSYVRMWLAKRHLKRQLLFKSTVENGMLSGHPKRGWLARKRGPDIQTVNGERIKAANRQDSPDFSHQTRPVSSAPLVVPPSAAGRKTEENNNNLLLSNNKKNNGESPTKAAILIQKCVRGYLTRKKVKAFHYRVQQQPAIQVQGQKDENHNQCNNNKKQFAATRMQLYQGQKSGNNEPVQRINVLRTGGDGVITTHHNNNRVSSSRIPLPVFRFVLLFMQTA